VARRLGTSLPLLAVRHIVEFSRARVENVVDVVSLHPSAMPQAQRVEGGLVLLHFERAERLSAELTLA